MLLEFNNTIVLPIPRCGSSSVIAACLDKLNIPYTPVTLHSQVYTLGFLCTYAKDISYTLDKDAVMIVRNPYDRVPSAYKRLKEYNGWAFKNFDHFLDIVEAGNTEAHMVPYSKHVETVRCKFKSLELLQIEKVEEWQDRLGLEIPHRNSTSESFKLTKKQKARIAKIYAKDFELGGYII